MKVRTITDSILGVAQILCMVIGGIFVMGLFALIPFFAIGLLLAGPALMLFGFSLGGVLGAVMFIFGLGLFMAVLTIGEENRSHG